jgi:hypothetical protein
MMRQLVTAVALATIVMGAQQAIAGGMPDDDSNLRATRTAPGSAAAASSNAAGTMTRQTSASRSANGASSTGTSSAGNAAGGGNAAGDGNGGSAFIAIEDDPLVVDASAIMDNDGMGNVQVQWQISDDGTTWMNLSGAVQQSFTPRETHVGKVLRVQISYVDGQGQLETLISPPSSPVQNVNDKPTGAPRLAGNAREEDSLVVDTSLIADEDGVGTYDIVWQRSSSKTDWQAYPNATSEVLQLTQSHVGYSYRAVVSYTDRHGTRETLMTNPSETVVNVDDPVEGEVILSGNAIEGATLTANTSRVTDEDGIASLTIGWELSKDGRNWRSVETNGSSQIVLTQAIVGKQVRARVSVVDFFGVETVIFSQSTNAVKNVNNKPAGTIFVRRVGS